MANGSRVEFWVGPDKLVYSGKASLAQALLDNGYVIPTLCHVPGLQPYGACRVCLVEVEYKGRRRVTTSCNHPVLAGIKVHLDTPQVQRIRRVVLELLLSRAPRSPALIALAKRYGVNHSRFEAKAQVDHCILCGLCTRVCSELAQAEAIVFAGRGEKKRLAKRPFGEFPQSCIACGACAWICPTDAISMEGRAVEDLRARLGTSRPCRYSLMHLLPGAVCEHDYRCQQCEVDQQMIDQASPRHPLFLKIQDPIKEPV